MDFEYDTPRFLYHEKAAIRDLIIKILTDAYFDYDADCFLIRHSLALDVRSIYALKTAFRKMSSTTCNESFNSLISNINENEHFTHTPTTSE